MKNILVTLDFEEKSAILITKGLELAEKFNAKIWLLHVSAPDPDFVGYEGSPQYMRDDRAAEISAEHKKLWDITNDIKKQGIEAEGLLIQGATIETILSETKKLNIDLIVTGYKEHDFIYITLFGSTATTLIKKSPIPILVVPLD